MNKIANIFFAFILTFILIDCSNKKSENKKVIDKTQQELYTIDTVLDGYDTKIILSNRYLKKGLDNKMTLDIQDVPNENILIYTRTSEATVKINNDTTGFLIFPKKTVDSVSIFVNINKDGKIILLGKINIKTK